VAWLVCLPIAYFFIEVARAVPIHGGKSAAAAFGWSGEPGTVTITHTDKVHAKGGSRRICHGDFRTRGGDPVGDVVLHASGPCRRGRVVEARLVRKDPTLRLVTDKEHDAYAGGGSATEPLVLLFFMGAFCLIVGGPFVVGAAVLPVRVVLVVNGRRVTRREG